MVKINIIKMKSNATHIKEVTKAEVYFVTTDEKDCCEYTRYSPEVWTVKMGDSDESLYDCQELEGLFQSYVKNMCEND